MGGRTGPETPGPGQTGAAWCTCESVLLWHRGLSPAGATARAFSMPGRPQGGLAAESDCLLWPATAKVKQ